MQGTDGPLGNLSTPELSGKAKLFLSVRYFLLKVIGIRRRKKLRIGFTMKYSRRSGYFCKSITAIESLFGESDFLYFDANGESSEDECFEWLQVGYVAVISPRTLVEQLGFTSWEEANEYISKQNIPPWWCDLTDEWRDKGRAKFEELVKVRNAG